LVLAFHPCLNVWFHVEDTDILCLFGCWILYWGAYPLRLFGCLSRYQILLGCDLFIGVRIVEKRDDGWRSRSAINFGWHYCYNFGRSLEHIIWESVDLFDCQKCVILQPNYCLFIASICMPISCPEIGGAICIIMV
jgi:hypothetical protein